VFLNKSVPKNALEKLERLYFVRDAKDLHRKYHRATEWFRELELPKRKCGD
jgi:hypothetical protein